MWQNSNKASSFHLCEASSHHRGSYKRQKASSPGNKGWNANSSTEASRNREEGVQFAYPRPQSQDFCHLIFKVKAKHNRKFCTAISALTLTSHNMIGSQDTGLQWPTSVIKAPQVPQAGLCTHNPNQTSLLSNGLLVGSTKHTNGYESTNRNIYSKHRWNIWFVFV